MRRERAPRAADEQGHGQHGGGGEAHDGRDELARQHAAAARGEREPVPDRARAELRRDERGAGEQGGERQERRDAPHDRRALGVPVLPPRQEVLDRGRPLALELDRRVALRLALARLVREARVHVLLGRRLVRVDLLLRERTVGRARLA
ncbi:hypothetical protein [Cellulomonas sp. PSBB021]|uniref:hypothetical protein n=1 Tax=Cellulomonas sp. PSBB021 TaxID=2003551 RepID=UPI0012FDA651|nr:hypothetical protein [Cellulomonas sp. PSBB021]